MELATRQNNLNSQAQKKKVADNIKMCVVLLKQREKEMTEEIETRREENEQALVLQQVFQNSIAIRLSNLSLLIKAVDKTTDHDKLYPGGGGIGAS